MLALRLCFAFLTLVFCFTNADVLLYCQNLGFMLHITYACVSIYLRLWCNNHHIRVSSVGDKEKSLQRQKLTKVQLFTRNLDVITILIFQYLLLWMKLDKVILKLWMPMELATVIDHCSDLAWSQTPDLLALSEHSGPTGFNKALNGYIQTRGILNI